MLSTFILFIFKSIQIYVVDLNKSSLFIFIFLGMSNRAGEVDTKHPRATRDAEIVRLCKDAGAIPICVTNTPELCMFFEAYNRITGRTVNPYDTTRTPAGSSGGEVKNEILSMFIRVLTHY